MDVEIARDIGVANGPKWKLALIKAPKSLLQGRPRALHVKAAIYTTAGRQPLSVASAAS